MAIPIREKTLIKVVIAVAIGVVFLGSVFALKTIDEQKAAFKSLQSSMALELEEMTAERAWYRWYFSEYAAALRLTQYGEPTLAINHLIHAYGDEFIPIESVTVGKICPPASHGAFTGDSIYFGARTLPLPGKDGFKLYAMSYMGSAEFAHSGRAIDALVSKPDLIAKRLDLTKPFGLIDDWLSEHSWRDFKFKTFNDYGFSALMSYNSGDIDNDGKADFVLERELVLSSHDYARVSSAPRRSMFLDNALIAVEGDILTRYLWEGDILKRITETELRSPAHPNVPYVVMPLPDSKVAVRTSDTVDIYDAADGKLLWFASISGFTLGEVQAGAFGDFTGDGKIDVWFSQVATPTPYPDKKDQIVLLRIEDIKPGKNRLSEIVWFTILGSDRYSDYDGIGTSLSPIAGNLLGDSHLDLSFTGHRHMNEAGALYILPGAYVKRRGRIDITHPNIIKILGLPMSQAAPPFHHWDADDLIGDGHADIIVAVDNDLCSGLNAGAIYTLSGKKIAAQWKLKLKK